MGESQPTEWQRAYQEALNETDKRKVMAKICAAEFALLSRLQRMPYGPTSRDEAMAIYDAVHALRLLRCNLDSQAKQDELGRMWKRTA